MEKPFWEITLVKGSPFSRTMQFEDDNGSPVDVVGKVPKMLIKYSDDLTMELLAAAGYFTLVSPTANGQVRFSMTTAQVQALPFTAASFYFFLDSSDEFLFPGSMRVR